MNIQVYQTKLTPFGVDVTFRVMTPDGYEEGARNYPVLYMHDGQDLFYDEDAVNGQSLRYAQYYRDFSRFLPQVMIVGIDCPMDNVQRTRQYSPYSKHFEVPPGASFEADIAGTGREYLEWIVRELKPWIDRNYRTRPQKEYTALGGYSTAGMLSTYGVAMYPKTFSRLMVISGAFYIWMDCLEQTLESCNTDHIRYIYLDVGVNEQGRMTTAEQFLKGAAIIHEKFRSYGFGREQLKYEIFEDQEHSQRAWRRRFPDAVRWIFQDL